MAAVEEKYSYTDEDVTRFMEVAIKLVKEAGEIITDAIARQKVVTQKESLDEKEKAEKSEGNSSSILTETGTQRLELLLLHTKLQVCISSTKCNLAHTLPIIHHRHSG